jgi:hypothetical protein
MRVQMSMSFIPGRALPASSGLIALKGGVDRDIVGVGEQRGTSAEQGGNGELFQSTLHVGDILCQRQSWVRRFRCRAVMKLDTSCRRSPDQSDHGRVQVDGNARSEAASFPGVVQEDSVS